MVRISSGVFMMGSPETEEYHYKDEGPQHRVRVGSFYMGKYEVTQAQYRMVMGNSPSEFKGDNLPVENVSWNEAVEFIRRLNGMQSAYTYRLPTEAEWEYACRAGTTTPFAFGSSLSSNQANFDGSRPYGGASKGVYRLKTTRVGSFQPNAWGLYDMHGNVMEWCEDVWHEDYIGAPTDGSAWLDGGDQSRHVRRGGSWDSAAGGLRSAVRFSFEPGIALNYCGFRLAATAR
jgi:formylglycine-generating enzyme required for sulfatase activity